MENNNKIKTIFYLGPKSTFTYEAAVKYFGINNNFIPIEKVSDISKKILENKNSFGVVPAENSIGGSVGDTLDIFIKTGIKIIDQITLQINQNLLSVTTKDNIKRIYTHPQSFYQCSNYLSENFKNVECIETTSNAKAAILAKEDKESAAIGPILCANEYGLNILEEKIQDNKNNQTKFFIISNYLIHILKDKSLIIFSVPNKPGSLYKILKIFKSKKINMTRIESRPSKEKNWEYVFIIEYENSPDINKNLSLIRKLKKNCDYFDYLGSY